MNSFSSGNLFNLNWEDLILQISQKGCECMHVLKGRDEVKHNPG